MAEAAPPRGGRAPPPPLGGSSSVTATRGATGVVCARALVRTRVAGPRGLCPGGELPGPVVTVFDFPGNGWAVGCGRAASRPSRHSLHADAVRRGLHAAEPAVGFGLTRGPVRPLCGRARFLAAWAPPGCAVLTPSLPCSRQTVGTGHPRACARLCPRPHPLSESDPCGSHRPADFFPGVRWARLPGDESPHRGPRLCPGARASQGSPSPALAASACSQARREA